MVLEGLLAFQDSGRVAEDGPDGEPRWRYELIVSPDDLSMGPFFRALLRVEAELLLHEADELSSVGLMRTADERRGEAFFLLARRVCEEIRRFSAARTVA